LIGQVGVDSKYSTDWDEKLRQHRERMKKLNIGTISSSTGNLAQRVTKPPPDVVLGTRTSNVMVMIAVVTLILVDYLV